MKYAAVLVLLVSCRKDPPPPQPKVFSSEEGRFRATWPAKFGSIQTRREEVPTDVGAVVLTVHGAEIPLELCAVMYSDYPAAASERMVPAELLEGCRKGALEKIRGTLEREEDFTLSGHPGRRFWFRAPEPGLGRIDVVWAKPRLYQIHYYGPTRERVESQEIRAFFDSFELLRATP